MLYIDIWAVPHIRLLAKSHLPICFLIFELPVLFNPAKPMSKAIKLTLKASKHNRYTSHVAVLHTAITVHRHSTTCQCVCIQNSLCMWVEAVVFYLFDCLFVFQVCRKSQKIHWVPRWNHPGREEHREQPLTGHPSKGHLSGWLHRPPQLAQSTFEMRSYFFKLFSATFSTGWVLCKKTFNILLTWHASLLCRLSLRRWSPCRGVWRSWRSGAQSRAVAEAGRLLWLLSGDRYQDFFTAHKGWHLAVKGGLQNGAKSPTV